REHLEALQVEGRDLARVRDLHALQPQVRADRQAGGLAGEILALEHREAPRRPGPAGEREHTNDKDPYKAQTHSWSLQRSRARMERPTTRSLGRVGIYILRDANWRNCTKLRAYVKWRIKIGALMASATLPRYDSYN